MRLLRQENNSDAIVTMIDDTRYAEIDIEPVQKRSFGGVEALRFSSVARPIWMHTERISEPITPRVSDPIRDKFYEMRKLASAKPFPRSDSELFYRQAKFMESFTDNYDGEAKFNMYFPYYQRMGYDYLRTYFTWRTKVREGNLQQTSLSYIFLYIYELLSNIGVQNPSEGLSKLMDIWYKYSTEHSAIEAYLPKWLKDYHIFYQLPHRFIDFVAEHNMQNHYSLTLLIDSKKTEQLALWNAVSGYNVTKSNFYKDGNEELFAKCYDAVLVAIQDFCEKRNTSFEDLLVYCVARRSPWQPFKGALFASKICQIDREIHISKYERYYCKNGEWTASLPIYYSSQKDFIGYILKKTEACLRNVTNYKYKLAAEITAGGKKFRELQRTAAKRAELDAIITKAVEDFYREFNRTVVTVNQRNLALIREEALKTQEQLIVEEETASISSLFTTGTEGDLFSTNTKQVDLYAEAQDDETTSMASSSFTDSAEPMTLSFADGWKALRKALSDIEREALTLILHNPDAENSGGAGIRSFASEKSIMLEVLIDGINEKASDFIGDSILQLSDEAYIYDEYRGNIAEIVRAGGDLAI